MSKKCHSRKYLKKLLSDKNKDNLPKVFNCLINIAEYKKDSALEEFARLIQNEYNNSLREEPITTQRNNIVLRTIRTINDLPDSYFPNDNIPEPTLKDIYFPLLEELAAELASNYYQVSFGETAKKMVVFAMKIYLQKKVLNNQYPISVRKEIF